MNDQSHWETEEITCSFASFKAEQHLFISAWAVVAEILSA
jgi:hypothetical protein